MYTNDIYIYIYIMYTYIYMYNMNYCSHMCNGGAHIHITQYFYRIEGSYYHEVRLHYMLQKSLNM